MKIKLLVVLLSFTVFQGCIKDDIGHSNEAIFTFIWDEMDQNYGGFIPRNINWDSLYTVYAPQAVSSNTEAELWDICTEMLDILDDQHIFLYSNNLDTGFASGKIGDELPAEKEFAIAVVKNNYLKEFTTIDAAGEDLVYGILENHNFGYLYIPNFEFNGEKWFEKIDGIIVELKDTDGLIIDVRNNAGGSPLINRYIAARFVSAEKFVFSIQTRNGKAHSDFDAPTHYYARPEGDLQYTNPTIILTNHSTVSAGEEFLLFLETQPHVTVVGDSTSNAFSTTAFDRLLPNGWAFGFPNQLYSYPDGSSPEGTGIVPGVYIRNDSSEVQNGIDRVLEKGIELL